MQIVRTTTFTKAIAKLNVTEAELNALEAEIASNPKAGDVIKGLKVSEKFVLPWAERVNVVADVASI